jgi:hypothetical protein
MNCPQCNSTECSRDKFDIGVSVQYGPWQCYGVSVQYGRWECYDCGWYEGYEVDQVIDSDREQFAKEQPAKAVFTNCNVCGIKLRTTDEDKIGMCERCGRGKAV